MLYVKIDGAGNPIEVAKSYNQIKGEFLAKNSIIPNEKVFSEKYRSWAYAQVPEADIPPTLEGNKIVPDVPVKQANGTMKRTYKYEQITNDERIRFSKTMRNRRKEILEKYIDNISPVRWEKMDADQKQEVSDYHQNLLDIPDDSAWPFVIFPKPPTFLM
jgi:hypothetical protein